MTIQERILAYLSEHPEGVDDDALTVALNLRQRQQANQRCRRLEQHGILTRRSVNGKIRNFLNAPIPVSILQEPLATLEGVERPWFWEGNVQARLVAHLKTLGYRIESVANTATKERGKDIVAIAPSRERLWVSAKGYPTGTLRTNPRTQARHWFAHAIFDLVLWRGEDRSVILAIAFPDQITYRNLVGRIAWFLTAVSACIFWIGADGNVSQQECLHSATAGRF